MNCLPDFLSSRLHWCLCGVAAVLLLLSPVASLLAQSDSGRLADQALQEQPLAPTSDAATPAGPSEPAQLNLLQLAWTARWLMLPILIMSLMVVALGFERLIALRRGVMIPAAMVEEIYRSTANRSGLNPRELFHVVGETPSPAANVVQAVLLKMGRPHGEVERTASETMQREADRLYRNVRPLNLAASVTPLIGLLGTVWGMIQAFFATANLPVGANKAESLAEGIYTALVTTAGGLVVAIPAAILAHYFEGRIERIFTDIHEIVYTRLMPHAERLENRSAAPRPSLQPVTSVTAPPPAPPAPPVGGRVPAK